MYELVITSLKYFVNYAHFFVEEMSLEQFDYFSLISDNFIKMAIIHS